MLLISDGLLIAGALAAAFYCYVLARRVRKLGDLDRGLGSAIAGLSRQVEDLQEVLTAVKAAAGATRIEADAAAERAERAANRLQLLLATTQLADEAGTREAALAKTRQEAGPGLIRPAAQHRVQPGGPASHSHAPQPGDLA